MARSQTTSAVMSLPPSRKLPPSRAIRGRNLRRWEASHRDMRRFAKNGQRHQLGAFCWNCASTGRFSPPARRQGCQCCCQLGPPQVHRRRRFAMATLPAKSADEGRRPAARGNKEFLTTRARVGCPARRASKTGGARLRQAGWRASGRSATRGPVEGAGRCVARKF